MLSKKKDNNDQDNSLKPVQSGPHTRTLLLLLFYSLPNTSTHIGHFPSHCPKVMVVVMATAAVVAKTTINMSPRLWWVR